MRPLIVSTLLLCGSTCTCTYIVFLYLILMSFVPSSAAGVVTEAVIATSSRVRLTIHMFQINSNDSAALFT